MDNKQFDDNEIDIAGRLMENMTLPTPGSNNAEESETSVGNGSHRRRKGVLGGEGSGGSSGADFGTIVQMHQSSGEYYQYDDPLGQWPHKFPDSMAFDGKGFGDCENDENDVENDTPVIDLFAGNLNFDDDMNGQSSDTGWANFDEGFAESADNGDTQIIDSSPDPFERSNSSLLIDDDFGFTQSSQFDVAFGDDLATNTGNSDSLECRDSMEQ